MTRVAILTIQGCNMGSFLQGYALKTYLEHLGHRASFIPTISRFVPAAFSSFDLAFDLKKIATFYRAWRSINRSVLDRRHETVVVGSDIVWHKTMPTIFSGYGIANKRVIAYAPSCGETTYTEIPPIRRESIRRMARLSARDTNTADIVEQITGTRPPIVMDPTFLIDWTRHEHPAAERCPYILVYSYNGSKPLRAEAFRRKTETGYELLSVGNYLYWCDRSIPDAHPLQFLSYVRNAEYILTDTYHGTIFSLIYRRPFTAYPLNHKTNDLLAFLGIGPGTSVHRFETIYPPIYDRLRESKKYLMEAVPP